jgi:hypothetical protein
MGRTRSRRARAPSPIATRATTHGRPMRRAHCQKAMQSPMMSCGSRERARALQLLRLGICAGSGSRSHGRSRGVGTPRSRSPPLRAASTSTSRRISAIDITLSAITHPLWVRGTGCGVQLRGVRDESGTSGMCPERSVRDQSGMHTGAVRRSSAYRQVPVRLRLQHRARRIGLGKR